MDSNSTVPYDNWSRSETLIRKDKWGPYSYSPSFGWKSSSLLGELQLMQPDGAIAPFLAMRMRVSILQGPDTVARQRPVIILSYQWMGFTRVL